MDVPADEYDGDPRDQIARLELAIERLEAKLENCRKFILVSRIAVAGGGLFLAALIIGAIRFDPAVMFGSFAAVLGGFVLWGSNSSTAQETSDQLTKAEMTRDELIGRIEMRLVEERPTLH